MAAPDGGPGIPSIANTSFPITTAEEGRQRVRELATQGALAIKIWVDDRGGRVKKLTPDLYRPIIEEAHAHGLMALAHVYYLKDAHELVDAGIDGFMHLVRDEVMDDGLIAKMKARHVFAAANIGGSRRAALRELPEASMSLLSQTVPADVVTTYRTSLAAKDPKAVATARATYDKMAQSLAKLNAAGVTIVLGGDTGIPGAWHGWAEQYELETMMAAGMSPAQVLVASTSAPAKLLKLDDMGTVAAGKSADFVVLDANPLADIANVSRIAAMHLRGQAVDRDGAGRPLDRPRACRCRRLGADRRGGASVQGRPVLAEAVSGNEGRARQPASLGHRRDRRHLHRLPRPYLHAQSRLAAELARQVAHLRGDVRACRRRRSWLTTATGTWL